MSDEFIDVKPTALARTERSSVLLTPVMDVPTALARLHEFQAFCAQYLQESTDGGTDGGDYGVIPGTKKKTLLKSGAEKLCEIYGLADEYEVLSKVEDWQSGLFDYTLTCRLRSRRDDSLVGTGVGSCSTFESKYRWRDQQKTCPTCGIAAIIKGKDFSGRGGPAGWLCWAKKGGCGAKFRDGDPAIDEQPVGRIENPDIIDAKNTALKMAKKRAKIDAVIGVTRSSGIFTQDMEDMAPATPAPRPVVAQTAPPARQEAPGPTTAPPVTHPAVTDNELPPPALISEPQRKRFYAISKSKGWTTEQAKALLERFGFSSSSAITKASYEAMCAALEAGPDAPRPAGSPMPSADEIFDGE